MPPTLADVTDVVETLWPIGSAEGWDAPGLLAGDPATEVTVTVSGEVMTLLPGFTKRVSATATVPRERFAE